MTWQGIVGQDEVAAGFRQALVQGRLASSYLFVGPAGVGKQTFARRLAQTLLCDQIDATKMDPCGSCPACQQVLAETHPDLEFVRRPEDKNDIPLALLIGAKDAGRRNKEGFCYNLSRKPLPGSRKIGIIDDADMLNEEGANCLLKTLEEPPPRSLLILIGSHPCKQLPTIRSRCQIIRFRPLSTANLIDLLLQNGCVENPEQAERLAAQSGGGLEGALVWADESLWPFRGQLLELLGQMPPDSEQLSKLVQKFIDEKSSPTERRKRLRLAMQLAEEFYRGLLYHLLGLDPLPQLRDEAVAAAVEQAAAQMKNSGLSATKIVIALTDRCLTAQQHIALYANPAALIGCWADDMARCPLAG